MNKTQSKIKKLVSEYKRIFPIEYQAVIKIVKEKREKQKTISVFTPKGGVVRRIKSESEVLRRPLLEYSETLETVFETRLTDIEKKYFKSKKGSLWFAKEFKEFRIPEYV